MLESTIPIKIFHGTLDEVLEYRREIPEEAFVEMRVYSRRDEDSGPTLAESLAELIAESEHLQPDVPIQYTSPLKQEYLEGVCRSMEAQGFKR